MIIFKNIIIFLVIFFLLYLIFPLNLYSQSSTRSAAVTNQAAKPTLSAATTGALAKEEVRRKKLNLILDRLNAAVKRVERISQRITSRLIKIKSTALDKAILAPAKLENQNLKLLEQIDKIKNEAAKLESFAATPGTSSNPKKDYQTFKIQAADLVKDLKDIQKTQKDLVTQLKQLVVASASPTIKAVPSL